MQRFGPSPYSAVLKTTGKVSRTITPSLTHGANLFLNNH
jgi:hypothetical protein